jgi:hypothetical protein
MRVIPPILAGLMALAAPSVQAVPNPSNENWRPVGTVLSFELGDQSCGYGAHQTLRRDWRGEWWWGPCLPNR